MIVLFTLGDKESYIGAVHEKNERGGPENGFADESVLVELVELHGGQGGHHVHKILRDYLHLRHCQTNSFFPFLFRLIRL
jgi:hypothetical protein